MVDLKIGLKLLDLFTGKKLIVTLAERCFTIGSENT